MKVIQKSGAWLWALLAALLLTVLLTATAFAGDNDFRCWTVDARQWTNQGYQSEKDGVWYLFLPQDESPADTVLSFSGRVTAASAGALDREGGTLTGAFADRDRVTLTLEGGRTETVCLRQSSLPSLRLILNGTTLDQIHQDKDVKYPGNDLVLTDGDDVLTGAVEIKGRGNSTWREYAKKPYQIKFSKKTSVLGMPAAKKWILLANASDDSMIRTRLVYDAAEQMDFPFVTEYQYVDLWIDGQYLGVYLLGEKAEIGKGRLNLQDPAGAMFELDNGFATDEDHYFFEGRLNSYFALKEIVEEDDEHIQQAMTNFQTAMTRLTTALTSQGWENLSLSQLNEMIDVDSLARYYLMNEYVLNGESFFTSFFWYQDGASDVLHVGPLWDFDTCMGNKNEKVTDYNASSTSVLMKKMLNIPAFYQRVQELYARYKPLLTGMAGQVDGLRDEIGVSADLNYLRWSTLGTANPKPGGTPFAPTYDEALSRVRTWLTGRAGAFTPTVRPQQLGYYFNASRTVMYLTYSAPSQTSLRFAVWGQQDGQNDLHWYQAKQQNGRWVAEVPLINHQETGTYMVHVYNQNGLPQGLLDHGTVVVDNLVQPEKPALKAALSADGRYLNLTLTGGSDLTRVWFPTWSQKNGQDDLQWYEAKKQADGSWTYSVALSRHNTTGTYFIHAYGNNKKNLVAHTTAYVEKIPGPEMKAALSADGRYLDVTLTGRSDLSQVWFPTWSQVNGQDDLRWHEAARQADGSWTCRIALSDHSGTGVYFIHAYGNTKKNLVAHTTVTVPQASQPEQPPQPVRSGMQAVLSADGRYLDVTLAGRSDLTKVWFPTWSAVNGQDDLRWYEATKQPDAVVQQTQPDTAEPDARQPQAEVQSGNAAGLTPITRTKNAVASGVTLEKVVMRNVNGSQVVGYLSEIDLSKDVTLKASYTGYYYDGSTAAQRKAMVDSGKLKWEMSQTTAQAAAYGRASDTEGRVVLATNADYYNMQTGAPTGYLIMEGNLVKTGAEPFFAILKDGSAVIRPAGSDTSDVVEAVSGPYMLVENGQIVPGLDQGDRMPRNSVGIRADGSVVFFEADGRQEPMSIGMSMYEVASFLKDAGCVTAIYLDGGGSATVAACYEGTDELVVRNSPSDGLERTVSDALLGVFLRQEPVAGL